MEYKEALSLAGFTNASLVQDVTQAFYETGAVALDNMNPHYAVAALQGMFSIRNEYQALPEESQADLLGLLAHFWTAHEDPNAGSLLFARQELARLHLEDGALLSALEAAREHCLETKEFATADRLGRMGREVGG
jgi:hypothetical protein